MESTHVIVGGGAAGFFAAVACAHQNPDDKVIILEKTRQLLTKVRISGGGRCNVTHACFDPVLLTKNYPRGSKELIGPFHRFQAADTVQWFQERGVDLKVEEDGRMFPTTDNSETIIHCLLNEAKKAKIDICLECGVEAIKKEEGKFILSLSSGVSLSCDTLLMATGSAPKVYPLLESLGHTVIPLVPSLFTFNTPQSSFNELAGISVAKAKISLVNTAYEYLGPLLITHWGLSGPAILKLSAWAARYLQGVGYKAEVRVNWLPDFSEEQLSAKIQSIKIEWASKQIGSEVPFPLPKQIWKKLLEQANINPEQRWRDFSKKDTRVLLDYLRMTPLFMDGKTTYKQEFVTCGGINLKEVNFKTMESRLCPKLYFAGEILDIDGITGGFNFQNAWTTGWIAGHSMGHK